MKIDFKKELKYLYTASTKEPAVVEVPKLNYLMVDGTGDPNTSQQFRDATEALYGMAYTLKFMIKKSPLGIDYTVMAMEGLWWTDDMNEFSLECKDDWKWTIMILQPEFVTQEWFDKAVLEMKRKKDNPALSKIRLESMEEGKCVQIMHIGPYSQEAPTVEKLHGFMAGNGYTFAGKHHEIYLRDSRRATPEKLKTILRQPVVKV